ncbi:hypothetical protein I8920_09455 [Curtobacterium sp. YC1]|uniref:hypothetical protein n=1 Tax=Curtobacterium sp. YC1 TaxID=2795488 RepID=UPI0018E506BF|nr:hypothetical protein [Curtobacterium sp. YC1]QQD75094.1 hypothetical protein I8920_09455 [Curtobacterium sp. YC1]
MSTTDNINATINYTVGQSLDNYSQEDSLDLVLTMLRKHGISPKYFEYEPERDAPKPTVPDVDVLEERRTTEYDSTKDETTLCLRQLIKGSI